MLHPVASSRRSNLQERPPRPHRYVRIAVWLMLVGAALDIAAAVIAITTEPSLVPWFTSHGSRSSGATVHSLVVAQGETQFAVAAAATACWLVMAFANSRARGNAPRIVSAVLLVMGLSYLRGDGAPRSAAELTLSVIVCLVGVAAVVLLFSDVRR
jgi:hypothetical protein